jgi:glycosyltransferase involved in cell wall biosynthesis
VKRWTANAYHALLRRLSDDVPIPDNCGDFRLMDRQVVDAILQFPERARYVKGLMAAAGFRSVCLDYARPPRHAGETSFGYFRLVTLALEGLTSFSTAPLRVWTYLGATVALSAFVFALWTIFKTVAWGVVTPGYATLLTVSLTLGGLNMVGIGVLGIYLGKILTEVKQRPVYIVGRYAGAAGRPRTAGRQQIRPRSAAALGPCTEVKH